MEVDAGVKRAPDAVAETMIRAAQYIRKSTEHQRYSTENQSDANQAYAAQRGMQIVRTYVDDGISGLTFESRDALQRLIEDVRSGPFDFEVILVYDVSRWGRYQDADESAYYEYICRRSGVAVHYCVEPFENDGSLLSALAKNLKRVMAGEFSRDLSVKVHAGQSRIAKLGFRVGASVGYGLRRLLVDQIGAPKGILAPGERKSIQTDRVRLIPGPPDELETVRWIFRAFVRQKRAPNEIARLLNERGIVGPNGQSWRYFHVRRVLTNDNYIGAVVWNRQSCKLKSKVKDNDPSKWLRVTGVIEAIVEPSVFEAAQNIIRKGKPCLSQEEKLEPLRRLLRKHGTLSVRLIKKSRGMPSPTTYYRWFGSLTKAYELVGFTRRSFCRDGRRRRSHHKDTRQLHNDELLTMLVRLYQVHGYLTRTLINQAEGVPSAGTLRRRFGSLERAYELMGLPWNLPNRPPRRPHKSTIAFSDEQLLDKLRWLLQTHGRITRKLLNETQDVPVAATYQRRFGGVMNAYRLIGYTPEHCTRGLSQEQIRLMEKRLLARLRALLAKHGYLSARLMTARDGIAAASTYVRHFGSLEQAYRLVGYSPKPARKFSSPIARRSRLS